MDFPTQTLAMPRFISLAIWVLFLLWNGHLSAQAPQVLRVSPANLSIVAPEALVIQIDFDRALDLSSIDFSTFKVSGRWTGPYREAVISMDNDNRTVRLLLDTEILPFIAGEWVTGYLTKAIRAANGEYLPRGYVWNFWIATRPGSLAQQKIKTIELRKTGEGLIQAYGAYAGDLNRDSYSDLTVVNETSDDLRILLNDGQGDYHVEEMTVLPMGTATPSPNEGADFNGDGDIDLAVCTAHDNELRVLFGDGEGHFYQQDDYETGENARGLAVLDYNGDGSEDILIVNRGSHDVCLFTNDGMGNFSKQTIDLDPNGFGESGLAVVDANNDGVQDLFIGNYLSGEVSLFLGDGAGNFSLSDKQPLAGGNQPWMLCTGDFNGDGLADVASANSGGNSMTVHFNEGNGRLSGQIFSISPEQALFPLAIDAGDLDGDGDLDLVTSNYQSATFTVFENDGTGDFSTSVHVLRSSDKASCAILHDRDNDGDLDITATDEGLDQVLLFENRLDNTAVKVLEGFALANLGPNPAIDQVGLRFELERPQALSWEVVDERGRVIRRWPLRRWEAGGQQLSWNLDDERGQRVAAGQYWWRVQGEGANQSYPIVVLGKQ